MVGLSAPQDEQTFRAEAMDVGTLEAVPQFAQNFSSADIGFPQLPHRTVKGAPAAELVAVDGLLLGESDVA